MPATMKTMVTWQKGVASCYRQLLIAGLMTIWSTLILPTVAETQTNYVGGISSVEGTKASSPIDRNSGATNSALSKPDAANPVPESVTTPAATNSATNALGMGPANPQLLNTNADTDESSSHSARDAESRMLLADQTFTIQSAGSVLLHEPEIPDTMLPVLTLGNRHGATHLGSIMIRFFVPPDLPAAPNSVSLSGEPERPWSVIIADGPTEQDWNEPGLYHVQGFLSLTW